VFPELLKQGMAGIVELPDAQIAVLQAHYELLLRWNQSLSLTTVTALEAAVTRHYCESLFLAAHLPHGALRIVDIGSGAGFPGFPVAVLRPDCTVTLIESHQRKAVFLREATRGMPNVKVLPKRAEEVAERFDIAISRAVSYADLIRPLKKLAPRADLLTGAEAPSALKDFDWDEGIPLPWGKPGDKPRFLRTGLFHRCFT
jgi:16S rRNA (guanine(527)-N(7))-methyltransferase RsmG